MDYRMSIDLRSGDSRETTYKYLVENLDVEDGVFTIGTLTHARYAAVILKNTQPDVVRVRIMDSDGNVLGVLGGVEYELLQMR